MDCCSQCLEFQVVVSCVSYNTRQQNRYNCRLESIICRFPSKISLSIPYPMNYWPNFPVFH